MSKENDAGGEDQGTPDSSSIHSEQCYCRECTKYGPPDPKMSKLTKELAKEWLEEAKNVPKERGIKALKENLLPFSRVRRIMKANQDVKMISAETPFLLTKAARYLIQELTSKSWVATTANSRRTLLQEDIKHSILKTEKFDFLVDVIDGTLEMEKQLGKYQPRSAPVTEGEPPSHHGYQTQTQTQTQTHTQTQQQQQQRQQPQQQRQQQRQQQLQPQTRAPRGYSYTPQQGTWSSAAQEPGYSSSSAYMPNAQYVIYQPPPAEQQYPAQTQNTAHYEMHGYNQSPGTGHGHQPK